MTARGKPIPFVDSYKAELLFRHKILDFSETEALTQERIERLLSWRNSGFGVHFSSIHQIHLEALLFQKFVKRNPVHSRRFHRH